MTKFLAIAFATATILASPAAFAQSLDIGPGGPRLDLRNERQREHDRDMRRDERRGMRDYDRRGGERCREVTVRERDEDGNVEVRRRRECR